MISVNAHDSARLQTYVFYSGIMAVILMILLMAVTYVNSPIDGNKIRISLLGIGLFLVVLALLIYNFSILGLLQFMVMLFVLVSMYSLVLYKYLIEQPTIDKLKLQSMVEGFRMYLTSPNEEKIRNFKAPEMTSERFERLLPYALALDVDDTWSEKFQSYLDVSETDSTYSMNWMSGMDFSSGVFRGISESMPTALGSGAVDPSSSGSSGGGFSGGGSGGGGGGGW